MPVRTPPDDHSAEYILDNLVYFLENCRLTIDGLKVSVENFSTNVKGANAQDVMNLVLMTQYFDTLKDIGLSSKSNTILIPHSPGGMGDISEQMRNAVITANEVSFGGTTDTDETTES